jgi:hypothetical protein
VPRTADHCNLCEEDKFIPLGEPTPLSVRNNQSTHIVKCRANKREQTMTEKDGNEPAC